MSRSRSAHRGRQFVAALVGCLAIGITACSTETPPSYALDPATGFPTGVFAKEFDDPDLGPMRIEWVFGTDGRWAEIPIALAGQPQRAPVARGTYRVDGDEVTVSTTWPPGWGTSTHRWRLDGDDLWTAFLASDVEADADWFSMLDVQPWRPRP